MKIKILALIIFLALLATQSHAVEVKKGLKKPPRSDLSEILAKISESSAKMGPLFIQYHEASQKILETSLEISKSNDEESQRILQLRDMLENIYEQTAICNDLLHVSAWISPDRTCDYVAFIMKRYDNYIRLYENYIDFVNKMITGIHNAQALAHIRNAREVLKDCKGGMDVLQESLSSHAVKSCQPGDARQGARP